MSAVGSTMSPVPTTKPANPSRPTVYLDQWVWIRMAQALVGRPRVAGDDDALEAIRAASAAGVAFPCLRRTTRKR